MRGPEGDARPASLLDGAFLVRRSLEAALRSALEGTDLPGGEILLLDVGGRGRPYAALAARALARGGRSVRHIVIDPGPGADVVALAESLPVRTAGVPLVLCTQALEHVEDPARAVAEMARALAPGGVCLLTTHGTWFYHPDPADYWRWTGAGLERLFRANGFEQVAVRPVGGTKLALASLALAALERGAAATAAGAILRGLAVAPCNAILWALLKGRVAGRTCLPGELVIDYLVTATRGRESDRPAGIE